MGYLITTTAITASGNSATKYVNTRPTQGWGVTSKKDKAVRYKFKTDAEAHKAYLAKAGYEVRVTEERKKKASA
jgi:hypothetical protein